MMLLGHGAWGICPLEVAAAVGGAGGLWAIRHQLAWWCRKFLRRVRGS